MLKLLLAFAGAIALSCDDSTGTSSFSAADCGKWIVTIVNSETPRDIRFLADSIESHDTNKVVLFVEGERAIWSGDDVSLARYQCP